MTASSNRILAGFALLLMGSTSALAADAQAFAERLKTVVNAQGLPMSFAGAEAAGENVTLKGVTVGDAANASPAFDVTFEGVTGSDAEGWAVSRIPIADVDQMNPDNTKHMTMTGVEITGLKLSGTSGPSTLPGLSDFFFENAKLGAIKVEQGGQALVSIVDASLTNTETEGGGLTTEGSFGTIDLDFAADPNDDFAKSVVAFGYPQLSGSGSFGASWNPASGELALDPLEFSFADAGALNISYQINGYTPSFIASLREIQKQMAANPADSSNSGMAILGLASQLSLSSTVIAYADDGFTNKLLDFYAKQNGMPRDALVQGLIGQVGPMLAMLNNPEFQTEVSTAVETFLKDPQSLTIAIAPDAPIPATQIVGAAMGAPQTLPSVLALSVTANEPVSDDDAGGDATDEPAQ